MYAVQGLQLEFIEFYIIKCEYIKKVWNTSKIYVGTFEWNAHISHKFVGYADDPAIISTIIDI